ncbi:MAG: hypothetical protein AAFY47_11110 [Pseudomonadota bacterium]
MTSIAPIRTSILRAVGGFALLVGDGGAAVGEAVGAAAGAGSGGVIWRCALTGNDAASPEGMGRDRLSRGRLLPFEGVGVRAGAVASEFERAGNGPCKLVLPVARPSAALACSIGVDACEEGAADRLCTAGRLTGELACTEAAATMGAGETGWGDTAPDDTPGS